MYLLILQIFFAIMYTLHKTMGKVPQIVGHFLTGTLLFREILTALGVVLSNHACQLDNCKICNIIDIMVLICGAGR